MPMLVPSPPFSLMITVRSSASRASRLRRGLLPLRGPAPPFSFVIPGGGGGSPRVVPPRGSPAGARTSPAGLDLRLGQPPRLARLEQAVVVLEVADSDVGDALG